MKGQNIPDLLTIYEVARILERSPETIRRWHKQKRLIPAVFHPHKSKARRYYTITQIHEFKSFLVNINSEIRLASRLTMAKIIRNSQEVL